MSVSIFKSIVENPNQIRTTIKDSHFVFSRLFVKSKIYRVSLSSKNKTGLLIGMNSIDSFPSSFPCHGLQTKRLTSVEQLSFEVSLVDEGEGGCRFSDFRPKTSDASH